MAESVVRGLSDLKRFLDTLPEKMQKNVLRGGMRAGAAVVLPVARAYIHPVSGETARSLKIRTGAKGTEIRATIYTRVFTARFLETGTKPHTITASGRKPLSFGGLFFQSVDHPGARPRPFLRPAVDAQQTQAVTAIGEYVKRRLSTKHGLDTEDIEISAEEREA